MYVRNCLTHEEPTLTLVDNLFRAYGAQINMAVLYNFLYYSCNHIRNALGADIQVPNTRTRDQQSFHKKCEQYSSIWSYLAA